MVLYALAVFYPVETKEQPLRTEFRNSRLAWLQYQSQLRFVQNSNAYKWTCPLDFCIRLGRFAMGRFCLARRQDPTDGSANCPDRGRRRLPKRVSWSRVRDVVRDDMRLAGIEAIVGSPNFYERITDGVRAWQQHGGQSVRQ